MDRALVKLMQLRLRGLRRQMLRGLKTPRGAVLFTLGMLTLLLWLGPSVAMAIAKHERSDPETVRAVAPLALLGICLITLLTAGKQKSVYFSPAEVDFLFAGPFSRRHLLVYKISGSAASAMLIALFLSMVFLQHATLWIAAFAGCFLSLLLIQWFSTAILLIGQTLAERAYTRARRAVLLVVLVVAAAGVGPAIAGGAERGFLPLARALRQSTVGCCLLAPFEPFGRTITAPRVLPDLVGWGTLALAVDLCLLGLVMWLDVNYLESAVAVSQKLYQRRQQARRQGGAWVASGRAAWHLPALPWLGGAGPIARKQLITVIRCMRGLVVFLIVGGAIAVSTLVATRETPNVGVGVLVFQMLLITILFARTLPFDFRGDLDCMDWLKSLPLKSTAIAAGQLITPTLLMTAIHLLVLGVMAPFLDAPPAVLLLVAAFTLPFNFLLFGLENLFFLLFPARIVPATPGDLQHIGRTMVELFVKILALAACCGAAAAWGGLGYFLSGGSQVVFLAMAWLGLAAVASTTVPGLAWAFRKFDVSVDTPA